MTNAVKLFDNIIVYKNAFTKCEELLKLYKDNSFLELSKEDNWLEPGVFFRSFDPAWEQFSNPVLKELSETMSGYKNRFIKENNLEIKELYSERIDIRKYINDTSLSWHADFIPEDDDTFWSMTINVYLNDEYDGGNIQFKMHLPPNNEETETFVDYKPEKGDLLIFPSGVPYYHQTTPVSNGTRYYANTMIVESSSPSWQNYFNKSNLKIKP